MRNEDEGEETEEKRRKLVGSTRGDENVFCEYEATVGMINVLGRGNRVNEFVRIFSYTILQE